MKTYLQAYFDKLKLLVLRKSQITQLVPADCYRLALEIKAVTNKSVSETTLKRVFGFASSIHQPSIYTLNALAEYCDFDCWDSFYMHVEQDKLQTAQQRTWGEVSLRATKISLFNIQSNKHKCGIPYHLTIDREHMSNFMEHFERSGATTGILSGPTGYGKTVAVSRWVEKQISQSHAGCDNDIYLFTNSLSLLQGTAFGYHCNRWLAHLLGFENSEILDTFIENHRNQAPGNFCLIIDELHSDLIADRQFYTVISQFIEMVRHFAQYDWFRIVLVLRTATLLKYEGLFKDTIINPEWFSILSGESGNESANMAAFSSTEMHQLIQNVNGKIKPYQPFRNQSKQLIHIPLFFQYYYELVGERVNPNQVTSFDEYLIVAQYLKKKVFNGVNTLAKQALMEELSPLIEQHNGSLQISKRQAYAIIKQYRIAYNDLLYTGILYETNSGFEVRQQTVIQFQSDIIAAYFLALQLFNGHNEMEQLIDTLNQSTVSGKAKTEQVKWLLLFYIESGDLRLVNLFENIPFIREDRFDVTAFICDGLHKLSKDTHTDIKATLNHGLQNSRFLDYILNYSCFQAEYEPNLEKLLIFELSETHEIILRSKLAVIALLKWEEDALLKQLEILAVIPPDAYASFTVNPFLLVSYLYQYFKGGGINQEIAREIGALPYRLPIATKQASMQFIDILLYLFVKVSGNVAVARYYHDTLTQRLEQTNPANGFQMDFTMLTKALYLLECGDVETAKAYVEKTSPLALNNLTFRLLHNIFYLQVEKVKRGQDYVALGHRALALCEAQGLKLVETYCRLLILERAPKEEQLQHINNLKFQFAAFGYTAGLGALSKKYG
ncbi:hypothetical protein [Parapedobacter pyrenivorans]|uniref:hypothetical protein n=1 Tax=Parapedobacter pyrenivorans TaxID=1305674 RepID=UPI00334006B0